MNAHTNCDPLREIRSMVLASFPCPPLPQLSLREETGCTDVISSHDTIASGMQHTTTHRPFTAEQEQHRVLVQMRLLELFNEKLDSLYETVYKPFERVRGSEASSKRREAVDRAYDAMQDYTRRVIATYMPARFTAGVTSPLPDARFKGIDDVCVGDTVHRRACEHLVALRLVVGHPDRMFDMEEIKDLPYRKVVERFFVAYVLDGVGG